MYHKMKFVLIYYNTDTYHKVMHSTNMQHTWQKFKFKLQNTNVTTIKLLNISIKQINNQ